MLHTLTAIISKGKKRLGQGWRSGSGKYSGRGVKGQKARGSARSLFEGGQLVLHKKLPMIRGKMKNRSIQKEPIIVLLKHLEDSSAVKAGSVITQEFLVKAGIVTAYQIKRGGAIKVLSQGKLTKKLTVSVAASAKAIEKIKAIGGEYQP